MDIDLGSSYRQGIAIARAFAGFVAIISRPLSLTTQVLFKKNMGERYFATWHAVVALGLIGLAGWACLQDTKATTGTVKNAFGESYRINQAARITPTRVYVAGGLWAGAFVLAAVIHRARITKRYQRGTLWHSRCSGEPLHPGLRDWARYLATGGLAVAANWQKLEPMMMLIVASLIATILADEYERWLFYNAVLDAVDGQIEAENLSKAVEKRLTPIEAGGLVTPMPAYVSDLGRKRMAEAIARQTGSVSPQKPAASSEVEAKPAEPAGMPQ